MARPNIRTQRPPSLVAPDTAAHADDSPALERLVALARRELNGDRSSGDAASLLEVQRVLAALQGSRVE